MDVAPHIVLDDAGTLGRGGVDGGRRAQWRRVLCWLLPAFVMAVLGAWALSRNHSLWYDEVYTAELSALDAGEVVSAVVRGEGPIPYLRDAPPSYNGPYYLVVHAWLAITGLAADEWGLRLLSLLAAVAAVGVFSAAVRTLAGPRLAVVAGLVLAANPFAVQYAAEARGYSLALLAVALAALGLARWLSAGGNGRPALLLFGAGVAAAGLLQWFALLVVAGLALAALFLQRRRAAPMVLATVVAAVPAVGLVATALANGVGTSGAEWLRGVGAADVPRLLLRSWSGRNAVLLVLTLVLGAIGLVAAPGRGRVVAAAWFGVPVAVVSLVELVRPVFVDRYLLPATPGLAVLVALGVTTVARRRTAVVAAALLVVSVWATVVDVRRGPKEDIRGAVEYVATRHQPGEPVVAPARWDALGLDHFTRRDHRQIVPDVVLAPPAIPDAPSLWVVRRSSGGVKGDGDKIAALEAELRTRRMAIEEERRFDGRYTDTLVQRWVSRR